MAKKIIIHPFLVSAFPIVSLYVTNRYQIRLTDVVGILFIIIAASLAIWIGISHIIHNKVKAAIITSIFFFIFFSFRYLLWGISIIAYMLGHFQQARPLVETQQI